MGLLVQLGLAAIGLRVGLWILSCVGGLLLGGLLALIFRPGLRR